MTCHLRTRPHCSTCCGTCAGEGHLGRGPEGGIQEATLTCFCTPPLRIVEVEQDNKMTPGNLGIVFGPTLLRPRPTEATVSLSSLVDYPHQARIVETLITHYGLVFEEEPEEVTGGPVRRRVDPRAVPFGERQRAPGALLEHRDYEGLGSVWVPPGVRGGL